MSCYKRGAISSQGLTLVELVITIGLVSLIGIPMGILLAQHLELAHGSREKHRAVQLAQAEMERLDSLNAFLHPDLSIGTTVLPGYQGSPYTLAREIVCLAGDCNSNKEKDQSIKRLRVIVMRQGSVTPIARLISYRANHVQFGN